MAEPLWILVGIGAFALGYLLAHQRPLLGMRPQDAPTREDFEMLRLHIDDQADKMTHLYDRIRKRYLAENSASPSSPDAPGRVPLDGRVSKHVLRERAAALGIWPKGRVGE